MSNTDLSTTETHTSEPNERGNRKVSEGESHLTNNVDSNPSNFTENYGKAEGTLNQSSTTDSVSNVAQQLEVTHVTDNTESVVSSGLADNQTETFTGTTDNVMDTTKHRLNEASENATTNVGNDAVTATQSVQDNANDTAHTFQEQSVTAFENKSSDVQETATEGKSEATAAVQDTQGKAEGVTQNFQATTNDTFVTGEKTVEENAATAKDTVLESANQVSESAKNAANEVSTGTQELTDSAKQKAEKGKEKVEEATSAETKDVASPVLEKPTVAVESAKPPTSTPSQNAAAVVSAGTEQISNEPVTTIEQTAAATPVKAAKTGPITTFRNWLNRVFNSNSNSQQNRQKSKTNLPAQSTATAAAAVPPAAPIPTTTTTTTTTVATTNPQ